MWEVKTKLIILGILTNKNFIENEIFGNYDFDQTNFVFFLLDSQEMIVDKKLVNMIKIPNFDNFFKTMPTKIVNLLEIMPQSKSLMIMRDDHSFKLLKKEINDIEENLDELVDMEAYLSNQKNNFSNYTKLLLDLLKEFIVKEVISKIPENINEKIIDNV